MNGPIMIIGANGSMGRRYQALLNYLGRFHIDVDIENISIIEELGDKCKGFIIATPTWTHFRFFKRISEFKKPILCEKPLSTDMDEVCEMLKTPLRMMLQYLVLNPIPGVMDGHSHYNYFNTGKDGLKWDATQIIGLARHGCTIQNNSPFWDCRLNGKELDLSWMDRAYLKYLEMWFKEPNQDPGFLRELHVKVNEFQL